MPPAYPRPAVATVGAVPDSFRARVVEIIRSTKPGEVLSYGDVAAQAGYARAARGVGAVLAGSGAEDGGQRRDLGANR